MATLTNVCMALVFFRLSLPINYLVSTVSTEEAGVMTFLYDDEGDARLVAHL